jgi:cob(I)alamin adenosyltransferase
MVRLNRIYTKTGDAGDTGLGDGERRPKFDRRIASYGTVDETNAAIGIARLHVAGENAEVDAMLARIQNDLFDLGADLCTPETPDPKYPPLRIVEAQVERLEHEIDAMNERLAPLNSFVLPGGSAASVHLHLARTVTRRAEREIVALAAKETINPAAVRYINRLSDHLFVLSRHLNADGAADVLWVPGKNR